MPSIRVPCDGCFRRHHLSSVADNASPSPDLNIELDRQLHDVSESAKISRTLSCRAVAPTLLGSRPGCVDLYAFSSILRNHLRGHIGYTISSGQVHFYN